MTIVPGPIKLGDFSIPRRPILGPKAFIGGTPIDLIIIYFHTIVMTKSRLGNFLFLIAEQRYLKFIILIFSTPTKHPASKGPTSKGPVTKGPASKGPASKGSATKSPARKVWRQWPWPQCRNVVLYFQL